MNFEKILKLFFHESPLGDYSEGNIVCFWEIVEIKKCFFDRDDDINHLLN